MSDTRCPQVGKGEREGGAGAWLSREYSVAVAAWRAIRAGLHKKCIEMCRRSTEMCRRIHARIPDG